MEQESTPESFADMPIGTIAARLPGATAIFREARLDFCCGGDVTLREAAARRDISLDRLLQGLADVRPEPGTERPGEPDALIPFIVARYHETHRRELPELVRLARRVEAVHRDHPDVPAGLAEELERVMAELEDHMMKEEVVLFPMMLSGGNAMIAHPVSRMRSEHDRHGENLRAIERLGHDFAPPPNACNTWRALYTGLDKFRNDLMEHIHLENNVLFPQFTDGDAGPSICGLTAARSC